MIKFKCIKDFIMQDGSKGFIKDRYYFATKRLNKYVFTSELPGIHQLYNYNVNEYFIEEKDNA